VRYVGVDLSWSGRALSGVCALDAAGTILAEDAVPADALPAWIAEHRSDRSLIAIDGPLIVPPDDQAVRACEIELLRLYGGRGGGPFPGGARSLCMRGRDESPGMRLLWAIGGPIDLDPFSRDAPHRAIEVFPTPTWLELFPAEPRLIYKRGPKADRLRALDRLRARLEMLGLAPGIMAERWRAARTLRDWKAIEDILDARLCAYVARLWDQHGDPSWVITGRKDGDWRYGYVIVPRPPS
jgi:predicted RNase H-like nuclease